MATGVDRLFPLEDREYPVYYVCPRHIPLGG